MSEQTKAILEMTSWPMAVKNPWKDSMVRSFPGKTGNRGTENVLTRPASLYLSRMRATP